MAMDEPPSCALYTPGNLIAVRQPNSDGIISKM
jgi:hypothetical protein